MPTIRILKHVKGTRDGITIMEFAEGTEHDVSDSLAKDFLSLGAAVIVTAPAAPEATPAPAPAAPEPVEEKAAPAPANKAKGRPKNKEK